MKINFNSFKIFICRIITIIVTMAMATLRFRDAMLHGYISGLALLFFMLIAFFPSLATILWKNEKKKERNFLILTTCGYIIFVFREYLLIITPILLFFLAIYWISLYFIKSDIIKIFKLAIYLGAILASVIIVSGFFDFISNGNLSSRRDLLGFAVALICFLGGNYLTLVSFILPFYIFTFKDEENKKWGIFVFAISSIFIANFLLSNYGNEIIGKKLDPCFEFIEGKGSSWYVKGDRVCIRDGYYMKTFKEADAKTFQVYEHRYAKDARNIFYGGKTMKNIDVKTFEVLNSYYAKTSSKVYYDSEEIQGADATTFEIIFNDLAKDNGAIYYNGKRYPDIDPNKFHSIGLNYYRDDNHVYFYADIVKNADLKTFRPLEYSCGIDGEKYFRGAEMVDRSCRLEDEMNYETIEITDKSRCFFSFCF